MSTKSYYDNSDLSQDDILGVGMDYLFRIKPDEKDNVEEFIERNKEFFADVFLKHPEIVEERLQTEGSVFKETDKLFCSMQGQESVVEYLRVMRLVCVYDRVMRAENCHFHQAHETAGANESSDIEFYAAELLEACNDTDFKPCYIQDEFPKDWIENRLRDGFCRYFPRRDIRTLNSDIKDYELSFFKSICCFMAGSEDALDIYKMRLAQYEAEEKRIENPDAQRDSNKSHDVHVMVPSFRVILSALQENVIDTEDDVSGKVRYGVQHPRPLHPVTVQILPKNNISQSHGLRLKDQYRLN